MAEELKVEVQKVRHQKYTRGDAGQCQLRRVLVELSVSALEDSWQDKGHHRHQEEP